MSFINKYVNKGSNSGSGIGSWTIGKKVLALSIGGAVATLLLGLFSTVQFYRVSQYSNRLTDAYLPEWSGAEKLQIEVREIGALKAEFVETQNYSLFDEIAVQFEKAHADIKELKALAEDQDLPKLKSVIGEITTQVENFELSVNSYQSSAEMYYSSLEQTGSSADELTMLLISLSGRSQESDITGLEALRQGALNSVRGLWRAIAMDDLDMIYMISGGFSDVHTTLTQIHEGLPEDYDQESVVNMERAIESVGTLVSATEELAMYKEMILSNNAQLDQAYHKILESSELSYQAANQGALEIGDKTKSTVTQAIWLVVIGAIAAGIAALIFGMVIGGSIKRGLNLIIERLKSGAEQVNASSSQLSGSSQSLAESASQQAASLEETTSSLEEMASQIKHTAENSGEAEMAMKESKPLVENGVEAMKRMTEAMEEIKQSSQETSKIIKTIDDIAFQTNLLALNAAVEAARAGEAGKGFAVVAEEVRNLAQRSAEAAQNTSELIQKSQSSSERGSSVAVEVSDNLRRIEESIASVSTLVIEISAASKEQAVGIEQMNSVMAEMDNVVQNNASSSEESASAAEELSSQAEELNHIIARLISLVGGSSEDTIGSSFEEYTNKGDYSWGESKDELMAPVANINDNFSFKSTSVQKTDKKSAPKNGASKRVEAHELIPFDDDDDFGDF